MPDSVRATALPQSQQFDPGADYLIAVRGDASGPRTGPFLIPAQNVSVGSASTGGGGGIATPPATTGSITKVFGRSGPEIVAQVSDYSASQIDYDPQGSGLAATTVQEAVDAVAALRDTMPVAVADGDVLTATGGAWSSQPPVLVSVFGRSGAVDASVGDYNADQISLVKTVGGDPNVATTNRFVTAADLSKLSSMDPARMIPDPSAGTENHILRLVGASRVPTWSQETAGGGGGLSQIDLGPYWRPDPSASPSWSFVSGTGVWDFSNTVSEGLFCEIDYWPGGTATLHLTVSCSATTGNVGFDVRLAAVTPNSTDLFDRNLAVANLGTVAVADAVKKTKRISIVLSTNDGAAAGDMVRIRLARNIAVSSNAAGACQLRGATLRFA